MQIAFTVSTARWVSLEDRAECLLHLPLINLTRLPERETTWMIFSFLLRPKTRREKERTLPANRRKLNEVPSQTQHSTRQCFNVSCGGERCCARESMGCVIVSLWRAVRRVQLQLLLIEGVVGGEISGLVSVRLRPEAVTSTPSDVNCKVQRALGATLSARAVMQ